MWEDYLARLLSRKFQIAIAVCIGNILLAWAGAVTWEIALNNIKQVVLGYLVVEGGGDALGKYSYYKSNKE